MMSDTGNASYNPDHPDNPHLGEPVPAPQAPPDPRPQTPAPRTAPPGLRLRALVLIAVLAATGLATAFRSNVTGYVRPTEAWLEDQVPAKIGDFTFIPSAENPKQSYKMGEDTYKMLDPIGIVARIYTNGREKFDVVVIMGDRPDSMHDPRVCLPAQNWEIVSQKVVTVQTRVGAIPMVFMEARVPGSGSRVVAFSFRGPTGFHTEYPALWGDFVRAELAQGNIVTGYYVRLTTLDGGGNDAGMLRFATLFFASLPGDRGRIDLPQP